MERTNLTRHLKAALREQPANWKAIISTAGRFTAFSGRQTRHLAGGVTPAVTRLAPSLKKRSGVWHWLGALVVVACAVQLAVIGMHWAWQEIAQPRAFVVAGVLLLVVAAGSYLTSVLRSVWKEFHRQLETRKT